MSGKNRAFALAIATAALVGFCAPVASAATFGGPNTGFNNDSILNLSGNQVPINACNNQFPIQGIGGQVPIENVTALLGLGDSGNTSTITNTESCANTPTETNSNTTNTAPMTMGSNNNNGGGNNNNNGGGGNCGCDKGSSNNSWSSSDPSNDPGNTGFNNDSILKVAGNQVPINFCNNQFPIQGIGGQVPVEGVFAALQVLSSNNTSTATAGDSCANTLSETNTSHLNT
jgi:hypothetical protein